MRRNPSTISLAALLRHPLVPSVLVYALILFFGLGHGAKLLLLEPVALASSEAPNQITAGNDEEAAILGQAKVEQDLATLARENALLRQAYVQLKDFDTGIQSASSPVPARVILRGDASNNRHSMYINVGSSNGVTRGSLVCIGRSLIGVVGSVSANTSQVTLMTDPAFAIPVEILPTADNERGNGALARGVVRGNGGKELRIPVLPLEDVPVQAPIKAGMIALTSSATGTVPAGFLVGTISEVRNRNTFLDIDLSANLDLATIDVVLVVPFERPQLDDVAARLAAERSLEPKRQEK